MKRIKTWNLFESNSLLYQEITCDECTRLTLGNINVDYDPDSEFIKYNWIPFTEEEISKIGLLIDDIKYEDEYTKNNSVIISNKLGITIFKLKDEWYYVIIVMEDQEESNLFFKCDQFDGLLKMIKDYI